MTAFVSIGAFEAALADLRDAWTAPIPSAMQAAGH